VACCLLVGRGINKVSEGDSEGSECVRENRSLISVLTARNIFAINSLHCIALHYRYVVGR
jgi:hypothetical protein